MSNILNNFKISEEREDFSAIHATIKEGIDFKGTNLWILIFAIFIASLGLNINSTAVVIGAMLISPLMAPIVGLGFGMAVNDLALLKKAISAYTFAALIGLGASTIYFSISPINEAHSEILARTAPTIYDVLIAFFGGLAGMLATSSRLKGNVIPGVAIATALMPPLCTAGYGLATLQFSLFFGALYLFVINTVFIALASLLTTRFLHYPFRSYPDEAQKQKNNRIVWIITVVTVLPSVYFGYGLVQQDKYQQEANRYIQFETALPNDYLLQKTIDPKSKTITLVYGGSPITETQEIALASRLEKYDLTGTKLVVQQGFAYLEKKQENPNNQMSLLLGEKDREIARFKGQLDSISLEKGLREQIYRELKAQQPSVSDFNLTTTVLLNDSTQTPIWMASMMTQQALKKEEKARIQRWLEARLQTQHLKLFFE